MKRAVLAMLVVACLGSGARAYGQLTAAEQAEYDQWEEFLRTAEIVGQAERLTGAQAVTEPWILTLEKDGIRRRALWKNVSGERVRGYKETWKGEIAAYRLSRLLGLHMVPPTVEREFKGDKGSCQLWLDSWHSMDEIVRKNLRPPGIKAVAFRKCLYLQRAFDNLISNEDRHQRNYLMTEDWRMILIDHSRTFRTTKMFTTRLIYDEKNKENPKFIMAQLPRAFVDGLRALTAEGVRQAVGDYLTDEEIAATMARRGLIIAWLDKRIADLGESEVLY